MYESTLRPVCDHERLLHNALWCQDAGALQSLVGHVPKAAGAALEAAAATLPDTRPERWIALAELLGRENWNVSAWVAYQLAMNALPEARLRAQVCALRIHWLQQVGQSERAECERRLLHRLSHQPETSRAPELEDSSGAVVCVQASPQEFKALRASYDSPLYRDPGRDPDLTKTAYFNKNLPTWPKTLDLSFIVIGHDGQPLLEVECDVCDDTTLSCRQSAVEITVLCPQGRTAIGLALRQIELMTCWIGADSVLLQTWDDDEHPEMTAWINAHTKVSRRMRHAFIDLTQSDEEILAGFRQTTRNLARWGLGQWLFASVGVDDIAAFLVRYKAMVEENGRTFVDDLGRMEDLARRGLLTLHGCRDADQWLAMVILSIHRDVANYSGSARGGRTAKSPMPALMYHAILDAKRRGCVRFCLGDLHDDESFMQKYRDIAAFKSGFTRQFRAGQWHSIVVQGPHMARQYGVENLAFTDI